MNTDAELKNFNVVDKTYNNVEYIYVLDYSDCSICEIERGIDEADEDIEDILAAYGCDIDTCSWMITDRKINNITKLN